MTSHNGKKGGVRGKKGPGANVLVESELSDTKYYQHNYSFFNILFITDLFTLLLTNCTFSFFDFKGESKVYIVFKQNVNKSLPVKRCVKNNICAFHQISSQYSVNGV
jgi:hypothetical protein